MSIRRLHESIIRLVCDGTYSVADLTTLQTLFHSAPGAEGDKYSALALHPDGALLALGTAAGGVRVFDFRSGALAASLNAPAGDFPVSALSFSENGYSLAAPAGASALGIWDLRKQALAHSWELGEGVRAQPDDARSRGRCGQPYPVNERHVVLTECDRPREDRGWPRPAHQRRV